MSRPPGSKRWPPSFTRGLPGIWDKFQQLLDGVDTPPVVAVIDRAQRRRWQDYLAVAGRLRDELKTQEALENRVNGDWRLLNYEIIPCLQFKGIIKKTKNDEGKKDDLH